MSRSPRNSPFIAERPQDASRAKSRRAAPPAWLCRGVLALLTLVDLPAAAGPPLRVQATLAELPRAPACAPRTVRVLARYRLERVLAGHPLRTRTLWVMHRCPELARGPTKYGRGTAPALKPGHSHTLELQPYEGTADVEPAGQAGIRYEALRTDLAPPPPRVAVVVTGPAGAKLRFDFEAEVVTVGRAADSDVLLGGREVALRQLQLEVDGDQVVVKDLQPGRVRLNGVPLAGRRGLTHKDTISVGRYSLNVSLFAASEIPAE